MKKLLGERGPQNMDEVGGVFEQFNLNRSAKIIARSVFNLVERFHNQRIAVDDLYNTHKHQFTKLAYIVFSRKF